MTSRRSDVNGSIGGELPDSLPDLVDRLGGIEGLGGVIETVTTVMHDVPLPGGRIEGAEPEVCGMPFIPPLRNHAV